MKSSGTIYALKIVEKKHVIRHDKVKYVMLEKKLLIRLSSSPFVINLHGTFQDERRLYFVLDYMPNGDLESFLKNETLSFDTMRYIMKQLVLAVGDLHSHFVVHRDLKPENILLTEDLHVKFIDFGSALDMIPILKEDSLKVSEELSELKIGNLNESIRFRAHSFVGTAHYVPPELIHSTPIPPLCLFAMDWWSLGVLFYQILTKGQLPFQASNDYLIFQKILKLDYMMPECMNQMASDLIRLLLKSNPEERIPKDGSNMCQFILQHSFFAKGS